MFFFQVWTTIRHLTYRQREKNIEYIRVEFKQSLGMNFVSPFLPEKELKVYKSCKCIQIIRSTSH